MLMESTGEDRYIDIKCDDIIGSQLSERILQDIHAQAIKLGFDGTRPNQTEDLPRNEE